MPQSSPLTSPLRRLAESWGVLLERREHEAVMRDPNLAAEHRFADAHATSHGRSGCPYCR